MRASFIALSTASLPEQQKNTRLSSIGAMSCNCSASSSAGPVVKGSKQL